MEERDTLIVKRLSENEVDVFYTDQNGKVLKSANFNENTSGPNGNPQPSELKFENEYPAMLGYSSGDKYNYWFGTGYNKEKDDNSEYTGKFNVFFGANAGNSIKAGNNNTFVGNANARLVNQVSSSNVITGAYNFASGTFSEFNGNVILGGYNAFQEANKGAFRYNVIIGHNNEVGRTGKERLAIPTESLAKLIANLNDYDKEIYGFDSSDNTISAISNNITIGNKNNAYSPKTPDRSIGSINIGSGNTKGVYRDFFNIYIGNHINTHYVKKANPQSYDNIIIGNFITTWQDQGILAIHNSTDSFTRVQDCLIYGSFRNRTLKINGALTLNPTHAPALNNTFTKVAIANDKGDLTFLTLGQLKGLLEGVTAEPLPNT